MLMERLPPPAVDFEFPLPAALRRLGASTRAILTGPAEAPLIVALGGISGNRFVCRNREEGPGWWPGVVGPESAVDPCAFRILGIDYAADASGRAAPSTADQALVIRAALDAAGAHRAHAIVGASYGGMVALSFAEQFPDRVGRLVVISAGAGPHAAATAVRELQRRVVALGLARGAGGEGLSIARGMAMLTYRTSDEFALRFEGGLEDEAPLGPTGPGRYLRARGDAFLEVMSPERFLSLSASIDRHKIDPRRISCPVLLIGATTDQLVPPAQMESLARGLPDARLHLLDCLYGHDLFLKEAPRIAVLIAPFLDAR
ncbi:MAG: alpha/beta fold hydrolase [Allosphingosinicella sp.]